MKKQLISIIGFVSLLFFFGGCGTDEGSTITNPVSTETPTEVPTEAPTEAPTWEYVIPMVSLNSDGLLSWTPVEGALYYEIELLPVYNGTSVDMQNMYYQTGETQLMLYNRGVHLHVRAVTSDGPGDWSDWLIAGEMEKEVWEQILVYSPSDILKYLAEGILPTENDNPTEAPAATEIPLPTETPAPTEIPSPTATPVPTEPTISITERDYTYIDPSAYLTYDISTDKVSAEVYSDDTTITYTIVTTLEADEIELKQLGLVAERSPTDFDTLLSIHPNSRISLNTLTVNKNSLSTNFTLSEDGFTGYSAARQISGEKAFWTIQWNLGNTAVDYIQIDVKDTDNSIIQQNYVNLDVHYPVIDFSKGLEPVITEYVRLNLTEPFFFTLDPATLTTELERELYYSFIDHVFLYADENLLLSAAMPSREEIKSSSAYYTLDDMDNEEFWKYRLSSSYIYSGGFYSFLPGSSAFFSMYYTTNNAHEHWPANEDWPAMKRNVLLSHYEDGATIGFTSNISDDMRAIIAYRNNISIDKETFPYAHSILKKAASVLDSILQNNMSDFEKARAIYQWIMDNYHKGLSDITYENEQDFFNKQKTSYGLLNGFSGDCSGWSATFYTLCNMAGVPCSYVDVLAMPGGALGVEETGVNHRINLVMLDGEFYFVDAYWFYQNELPSDGDWRYFLMTTEEAEKYYTWSNKEFQMPPICNYDTYKVNEHTGECVSFE